MYEGCLVHNNESTFSLFHIPCAIAEGLKKGIDGDFLPFWASCRRGGNNNKGDARLETMNIFNGEKPQEREREV